MGVRAGPISASTGTAPPRLGEQLGLWWLLLARQWRHHPWRQGAALLAVMLGVALAYSVHLINQSALQEFSQAVRSANGQPDLSLRSQMSNTMADELLDRVAADPAVALASPVLEIDTHARSVDGRRVPIRVLGLDALLAAPLALELMPQAAAGMPRLAFLDPQRIFLNAAARQRLGNLGDSTVLSLQAGPQWLDLQVSGAIAAGGPPLAVMDLAGAQHHFNANGRLSRIDLRLAPGADAAALLLRLQLPAGVLAATPQAAEQRVSNLSRAYRVNLTVLALVALCVGGFLVFSVVSLSVAQRIPAFALLGVLGMSARERRLSVLLECAVLGLVGSLLGLLAGAGMAQAALYFLAGDLGGAYFPGVTPRLQLGLASALVFASLGLASALAGGWWPARQAQALSPAQALKGLGSLQGQRPRALPGLLLLATGAAAALLPPVAGLPLAAYAAVAALLFGGVALVPAAVHGVLAWVPTPGAGTAKRMNERKNERKNDCTNERTNARTNEHKSEHTNERRHRRTHERTEQPVPAGWPGGPGRPVGPSDAGLADRGSPLRLLALQRARFARGTAAAAMAGIVASLALSVALTVMVSSFRSGVSSWLEQVLPADLYARTSASSSAADQAWLAPDWVARARSLPQVHKLQAQRLRPLQLAADRPAVVLVARPLDDPAQQLPLLAAPLPARLVGPGEVGLFVTEAMVSLYGAQPGSLLALPLLQTGPPVQGRVLGVWRDYARQFGAVAMAQSDYQRITGDQRINELALWLKPGGDLVALQAALRKDLADPSMLEFASSAELRRISLRIFDRSFAVTYYLQALAIGIGLVGIAASLSAQVLARRKEFGLLTHLGLTRTQIVAVVSGEAMAWVAAGCLVGLLLGLAISVVLVSVVNPQSFHWTMDLVLPWGRLVLLCAVVLLAGTATAAFSARRAVSRQAVLSVREDW